MPRRYRLPRAHGAVRGPAIETLEQRTLLSTYTVTNANDGGAGSLRAAILSANGNAGADVIKFAVGSGAKTIAPTSALPSISGPTVLDATSQPGYAGKPLIELNGTSAGTSSNGLKVIGGSTTIKGFVINRFGGSGILLMTRGGNKVAGN